MTTLKVTQLQITCTAESDITFGRYKAGNSLRNGMANNMLRMICPEKHRQPVPSQDHWNTCPACFLLAADTHQGRTTRRYALAPPVPNRAKYLASDSFDFKLTLFGEEALQFLPHFILAINETGRLGVGFGSGQFKIDEISAVNPFRESHEVLLKNGESTVSLPTLQTTWEDVNAIVPARLRTLKHQGDMQDLVLDFKSPLRIEESKRPLRVPDFSVFFKRLLWRIDELGKRYGSDDDRPKSSIDELLSMANQVRLVDSMARWQELKSNSGRTGGKTPFSGIVGQSTYSCSNWNRLLPYLIWGELLQVGKSTSKGNGLYRQIKKA